MRHLRYFGHYGGAFLTQAGKEFMRHVREVFRQIGHRAKDVAAIRRSEDGPSRSESSLRSPRVSSRTCCALTTNIARRFASGFSMATLRIMSLQFGSLA